MYVYEQQFGISQVCICTPACPVCLCMYSFWCSAAVFFVVLHCTGHSKYTTVHLLVFYAKARGLYVYVLVTNDQVNSCGTHN